MSAVFPEVFIGASAVVAVATIGAGVLAGKRSSSTTKRPPKHGGAATETRTKRARRAPAPPPKPEVKAPPPKPEVTAPPPAPPKAPPAKPPAKPVEPAEAPAQRAPAAPAPPAPPPAPAPLKPPPAAPAPAPELARERVTTRLRRSLTKSRAAIGERLSVIVGRGRLDDEAWEDIEEALIRADVGVEATDAILESLRRQHLKPAGLEEALRQELVTILDRTDRSFRLADKAPSVWLVTGVNGTGKTTSIAKLTRMLQEQGHSVVLAAADTFRAAAIDQLGTWAERLGVHMIRHAPGADPGAVVFDAVEYA
ncbi:MAG TPA: signal recognition particle receptor subunit alpha, partial [Actinomycetota bacterium]|nr:signal recognition particle receptor subunit alpha [Actinomycetota bacterium]